MRREEERRGEREKGQFQRIYAMLGFRTKELDREYGDLQNVISDLETCICTELIRRLAEYSNYLQLASAAAAEADCLVSMAALAKRNGYCRPQIVDDNVIRIRKGR